MTSHVKPSLRESSTKQKIILILILLFSLYPFVMANASVEPFVLGLPWWYWGSLVVLAVIYGLSVYLVLDIRNSAKTEVTGNGN